MNQNFALSFFGVPVFSAGYNPKAIIAVGIMPYGVIAIGWFSFGVFAIGQVSVGVFTCGQLSAGVVTLAQLGASIILIAQVGLGIIAGFGQGVAGFISNCFGYYKVDFDFSISLKKNLHIIIEKVLSNPRPFIIWSASWFITIVIVILFLIYKYADI